MQFVCFLLKFCSISRTDAYLEHFGVRVIRDALYFKILILWASQNVLMTQVSFQDSALISGTLTTTTT